jgi:hypothetical protein
MAQLTVTVGGLLVILGVAGYVMTDMVSPTALIPAVFGAALAVLGLLGRAEARRKSMMHLAMGVALLGIIGSIGGLSSLPALLSGAPVERPAAAIAQSVMALTLILYLGLGIRTFVQARRGPAV